MLLRPVLAVLVAADRDVLGAVVGGKLAAAEGERGRPDREQAAQQLLRDRAQARLADGLDRDRRREHRAEHVRALERELRLRERAPDLRDDGERLEQPGRSAEERRADIGRAEPLALRGDLDLPIVGADRAGPGGRPVHEHAVGKRHSSETDLLLGHG